MSRLALLALVLASCSGDALPSGEAVAQPARPAPKKSAPPADAGVVGAGSGSGTAASSTGCKDADEPEEEPPAPTHDKLTLTRVAYKDLPAWADDKHAEAVPSFLRSCERLALLKDTDPVGADGHGGRAWQWRKACKAAAKVPAGDDAAAKTFFETEFVPWQAAGKNGVDGKMTGYYVQEMRASRKKQGKYQTPVYARPKDLVSVELGRHIRDGHGRRIWGRLSAKGELVEFPTRKQIRLGALNGQKLELMYVDEPIDLLFAHIEGSAKAKLDDGTTVWLDFAGKNGRSYRGVGAILKGMGALSKPGSGTMQGIRKWFEGNRDKWNQVVDQVASFVFFEEAKQQGAMGTQLAVLSSQRSIAVDRAFIALSTPVWVSTTAPIPGTPRYGPWRQLLIAQDTGGGILGAVRGDIYWGDDSKAADIGGRMGGKGRFWLLLPKGVTK